MKKGQTKRSYGDGGRPTIELKDTASVDVFPDEKVISVYHSDGTVTFICLDNVCETKIHGTPNAGNVQLLKEKLKNKQGE